jgi:hypothetical protein
MKVSYISHINSKHGMNLKEYREHYGAQEEIKQYTCRYSFSLPKKTRHFRAMHNFSEQL